MYNQRKNVRQALREPAFKKYLVTLFTIGTIYLILCTVLMSYALGSLYKAGDRVHNLRILAVDFDGSDVGAAFNASYEAEKGNHFPTFEFDSGFTDAASVRNAVHKGHYWAAIYTSPNATSAMRAGLNGSSNYDATQAMTYVWNAVHYTSFSTSTIKSNLVAFSEVVQATLVQQQGPALFKEFLTSSPSPDQITTFTNLVGVTEINLQPTPQLASFMYNTICMVIIALLMFFVMIGTHMVAVQGQIYTRYTPMASYVFRLSIVSFFAICYSALITGAIWWFKESWNVNSAQFVLSWLVLILFMFVSFLFFDCVACFLPVAAFPIFVILYIITSVVSTLVPLPFSAGFFKWSYALPAFNAYSLLASIWGHGASPVAYRALPILFGYVIILGTTNVLGHIYCRCKVAGTEPIAEEDMKRVMSEI